MVELFNNWLSERWICSTGSAHKPMALKWTDFRPKVGLSEGSVSNRTSMHKDEATAGVAA
jgi:hypothetical protein